MFESVEQIENHARLYRPLYDSTKDIDIILKSPTPSVSIKEINKLRKLIAQAALGEYFLIQLGDGAGHVYDCDPDTTYEKLEFIQQVAEFFQKKTGNKVVQVGQIADPKTYTSYEALLLGYEQALTRLDKRRGLYYNRSTHFPWLDKSNISSMEHMDYLKRIANPMALKIGPDTSISTLIKTLNQLDPDYIPGRITLIPRLGVQEVHRMLPPLIEAVNKSQRTVLWSCDPMHGNTETLSSGRKIRTLSAIIEEIKSSFLIHRERGSQLNAIHLEATYQNVRECMDYESSFSSSGCGIKKSYKNLVNPRLNYAQTMHVIQCVARYYIEC